MIEKPFIKLGIIILPIIISGVFEGVLREFFHYMKMGSATSEELLPLAIIDNFLSPIILGLAVYLSIRLWIKYVHKTKMINL